MNKVNIKRESILKKKSINHLLLLILKHLIIKYLKLLIFRLLRRDSVEEKTRFQQGKKRNWKI